MSVDKVRIVVPYIGTWIETNGGTVLQTANIVVPYIGTWIETREGLPKISSLRSYLI